jgi:hypothetical protein
MEYLASHLPFSCKITSGPPDHAVVAAAGDSKQCIDLANGPLRNGWVALRNPRMNVRVKYRVLQHGLILLHKKITRSSARQIDAVEG